jgi:hypothetical protein
MAFIECGNKNEKPLKSNRRVGDLLCADAGHGNGQRSSAELLSISGFGTLEAI